jgi:hypothetical protein
MSDVYPEVFKPTNCLPSLHHIHFIFPPHLPSSSSFPFYAHCRPIPPLAGQRISSVTRSYHPYSEAEIKSRRLYVSLTSCPYPSLIRFIVPLCEKADGCVAAPSHILLCWVVLCRIACGYIDHLKALFLSLPLRLPLPSAVCLFNFAKPPSLSSALYDRPLLFYLADCISSFSFPFRRLQLAPARPSFHHTFRCGSIVVHRIILTPRLILWLPPGINRRGAAQ